MLDSNLFKQIINKPTPVTDLYTEHNGVQLPYRDHHDMCHTNVNCLIKSSEIKKGLITGEYLPIHTPYHPSTQPSLYTVHTQLHVYS